MIEYVHEAAPKIKEVAFKAITDLRKRIEPALFNMHNRLSESERLEAAAYLISHSLCNINSVARILCGTGPKKVREKWFGKEICIMCHSLISKDQHGNIGRYDINYEIQWICKSCNEQARINDEFRIQNKKQLEDWPLFSICALIPKQTFNFEEALKKRIAQIKEMQYQDYLNTPEWKMKRDAVLKFYGGKCYLCNSDTNLNVHHKTYSHFGLEPIEDLILLCHTCHEIFHELHKKD